MRWSLLGLLALLGCDEAPALPVAPVRIEAPLGTPPAEPPPPAMPAGVRPDGGMLWDHRPSAPRPRHVDIQVILGTPDQAPGKAAPNAGR